MSKSKLYKSLLIYILFYGCETRTLLADCERKGSRHSKLSAWRTSLHLPLGAQDRRLGAEQDHLPCGSTGTSSGNCKETETCMVRACYMPRQPLRNHPSGNLGGWATSWSAEEIFDGQHHRVDIPAHARTAHNGLLQKQKTKQQQQQQQQLEDDLCCIVPHVPRRPSLPRDWTEL